MMPKVLRFHLFQTLIAKQQKLSQQKTQTQKQRISSLRRLFSQFNKVGTDVTKNMSCLLPFLTSWNDPLPFQFPKNKSVPLQFF